MKQDKIKQLLPLLGSHVHGHRAGWVLATCPMFWNHGGHAADAFAVSYSAKKKSRVHCMSCGYSGDFADVLLDVAFKLKAHPEYRPKFQLAIAQQFISREFEEMELTAADIPDYEAPVIKVEIPFPEVWLASFKPISMFPEAVAYCNGRGILTPTLKALDVRYDPLQKRVGFPFRNFKGQVMGLQGRSILKDPPPPGRYNQYGYRPPGTPKDEPAHRNSHCWMGENMIDLDQPVVAVEGPIDYAKVWQVYPNVAASFTSGLSRTKCLRLGDAAEIITFYDHGMGGDAARKYLRQHLPGKPTVDIIPTKEQDDAGAMSTAEIASLLQEHVSLPKGSDT